MTLFFLRIFFSLASHWWDVYTSFGLKFKRWMRANRAIHQPRMPSSLRLRLREMWKQMCQRIHLIVDTQINGTEPVRTNYRSSINCQALSVGQRKENMMANIFHGISIKNLQMNIWSTDFHLTNSIFLFCSSRSFFYPGRTLLLTMLFWTWGSFEHAMYLFELYFRDKQSIRSKRSEQLEHILSKHEPFSCKLHFRSNCGSLDLIFITLVWKNGFFCLKPSYLHYIT